MSRINPKLKKAAEITVNEVLKVKKGERMLIVTNPVDEIDNITFAVFRAAREAGAQVMFLYQDVKKHGDYIEPHVLAALKIEPDVYFQAVADSRGKDPQIDEGGYNYKGKSIDDILYYLFEKKVARGCWCNGVFAKDFSRLVCIDYKDLGKNIRKLNKKLEKACEVIVKTDKGSDFVVSIRKRKPVFCDDGNFYRKGDYGNLPCGEVFVSPDLDGVNGRIAVDVSMTQRKGVRLESPVFLKIKDNRITKISGGRGAKMLREDIARAKKRVNANMKSGKLNKKLGEIYLENIMAIGELGIGLNPKARLHVSALEDEKVINTVHVAIGCDYDGKQPAPIHFDCIISKPEVTFIYPNGRVEKILESGKLYL
ncbi:MAG: hypothetical protein ACD_63C00195G0001 [uncultured bacterium]|nr:MAG: hypothetical protein ACD_63C00195G0001 [uncultured bacterium]